MKLNPPKRSVLFLIGIGLFLLLTGVSSAADNFVIAGSAAGSYAANQSVTFVVAGYTGSNPDPSFNDTVTVGMYDNTTVNTGSPILTDPRALITVNGAAAVTGTAVATFVPGSPTTFVLTLKTGTNSNGEAFWVRDATITNGDNIGPFSVTGFTTTYFDQTASGTQVLATYPTNSDILTIDSNAATAVADVPVTIPYSADGTTAASFAVSQIDAAYSGGGADISTALWAEKVSGASASNVYYQIIIDYTGSMTSWNTIPPGDSIYQAGPLNISGVFGKLAQPTNFGAPLSQTTGLTNGQIVLRIWTTTQLTNAISVLRIKASNVNNAANIVIPYSSLNALPVEATLNPDQVLAGSSKTMVYTINNLSNVQLQQTRFKLPSNGGSGTTPWTLSGTPTTRAGGTVTYVNPTLSADGYVDINWSSPVTVGESVAVTLVMNPVSNLAQGGWDFSFLIVKDVTNATVLSDSTLVQNIQTLSTSDIPGTPTPMPINYTSTGGQIALSWNAVSGSQSPQGYLITRNPGGGNFTTITLPSGTVASNAVTVPFGTNSYTDTSATNLTGYTYTLQSFNDVAESGTSAPSAPVTAFANPGPPTAVLAKAGDASAQLSWATPVPVSGSYPIAGYQIWRSPNSDFSGAVSLNSSISSPYTDPTAGNTSKWYYEIAATDSQYSSGTPSIAPHISALSGPVTAYPPGWPPTGLAVTLTSSSPATLELNWTAPTGNLNSLTNYYIYRGVNGPPSLVTPYAVAASSPVTFDDTSVVPGSFYVYEVGADNGAGVTTNPSSAVTGRVGPVAPTGLAVNPSAAAVTLNWNAVANSLGETVVSYMVYRNGSPIGTPLPTSTPSVTAFDPTAVVGTDYFYQVAAVDQVPVTGGLSSGVSSALLPTTPGGLGVSLNLATDNVAVTWVTPVPTQTNLQQYYLTQSLNGAGATTIATPAASAVSYLDASITSANAGTTVLYKLLAQNDLGGVSSAASVSLIVPPNAPVGVGAISSSAAVSFYWTARPGSENVTNYKVYRVDLSGPTTVAVTVGSSPVTYSDATALTGKDYTYFVTAINAGGEGLPSGTVVAGRLPQTPAGLAVTGIAASNSVSLAWTDVTGTDPNATSVSVLVSNTNNSAGASQVYITPANTITYFDQGVFNNAVTGESPDTTYYYWLATNSPFGSSALAGPVSQLTYPGAVNLAPVTIAPDGVSRLLSWSTLPADVTSYNIYRQQQGGGAYILVKTYTAASLPFPAPVTLQLSVSPGKVYNYKVTAVNATGEGPFSNIQAVGIAPSVPVSVTAVSGVSSGGATVNLSWSDPATVSENVTGYTVYRASSNATTASYSPVGVELTPTNYSDGGATPAVISYYLVGADNSDGLESALNTANAVAVTAYALPQTPAISTEIDGSSSVNLTWNAVSSTTYAVAGYNIYDSLNGGATVKANATPIVGTSGTASGLTNGGSYNLYLQTVDSAGHLSALSSPFTGLPVVPPGQPVSAAGESGNQAVQITWNAATAGTLPVGSYLVFISQQGSGVTTLAGTTGSNSTGYVITGLNNGTTYLLWVETADSSGVTTGSHVSSMVGPVTGIPGLFVNPPGNVTATGAAGAVTLTWSDAFTGSGAPVTGYQLWRSTSPAGGFSVIATPPSGSPTYTDSSVSNGTTYYYYFISFVSGTASSASATVVGTPAGAPAAPTGLTASDGVSQVSLAWTAPATVNNVPVTGYILYRDTGSGFAAASTISFPAGSPVTTYKDSGVSPGPVSYYLVAYNQNGTTSANSSTVTAYPYDMTAPTGLASSSSAAAVTMTAWTAPGTHTFPISYYQVLRGTASGAETPLTITGSPVTGLTPPLLDTNGTKGQIYYYELEAVDNKGHVSPVSNEILDSPANGINAPATVLISAGDGQVLLDWQAPVSAAGSLPVSEYIVTPISGSAGTAVTVIARSPWDLQLGLADGTPVSFTVQAVDTTGQTSGSHISAPVTVTISPSPLVYNPPTGLTATATNSNVQLTWTRPNDMGRQVLSYNIYRMESFTTVLGSAIANVPDSALAPVTTYTDATATASTTYYYVVTAVYQTNLPPPPTTESPSSNHALVTTGAPNKAVPPVTVGQMGFDANVLKPLDGQVLGIYYVVPNTGPVEIDIYNIKGYPVKYMDPGVAQAGVQASTTWDGKDRDGKTVASGVYLLEIKANGLHQIKKVIVVK